MLFISLLCFLSIVFAADSNSAIQNYIKEINDDILIPIFASGVPEFIVKWRECVATAETVEELEASALCLVEEYCKWGARRDKAVCTLFNTSDIIREMACWVPFEGLSNLADTTHVAALGVQEFLKSVYITEGEIDWMSLIGSLKTLEPCQRRAIIAFIKTHWPKPMTGYACGFMKRTLGLLEEAISRNKKRHPWGYDSFAYIPGQMNLNQALVTAGAHHGHPQVSECFLYESRSTLHRCFAESSFNFSAEILNDLFKLNDETLTGTILSSFSSNQTMTYSSGFVLARIHSMLSDKNRTRASIINQVKDLLGRFGWQNRANEVIEALMWSPLTNAEVLSIADEQRIGNCFWNRIELIIDSEIYGKPAVIRIMESGFDEETLSQLSGENYEWAKLFLSALFVEASDEFIRNLLSKAYPSITPEWACAAIKYDRSMELVEHLMSNSSDYADLAHALARLPDFPDKYLPVLRENSDLLFAAIKEILKGAPFNDMVYRRANFLRKLMTLLSPEELASFALVMRNSLCPWIDFVFLESIFKHWSPETAPSIIEAVINTPESCIYKGLPQLDMFLQSLDLPDLLKMALDIPSASVTCIEFRDMLVLLAREKFGAEAVDTLLMEHY